MTVKKISALIMCLIMIIVCASCGNENNDTDSPAEFSTTVTEKHNIDDNDDITIEDNEFTAVSESDNSETTEVVSESVITDDPANWSYAQIVDAYKAAAKKTHPSAKCQQKITLADISINNGQFESGMKFVKSIISAFLNKNSTEIEGITGGYTNLTESDVLNAKAYKVGNNTAIEMVMKNQTDGPKADALAGSVGHVISVVGDITVVTAQLTDMGIPLELSEKDTSIHYTKPIVKVLIDNNGNIIKGTWSYRVDIRMNNYQVMGTKIDTTSVVMDNTITLGGGF